MPSNRTRVPASAELTTPFVAPRYLKARGANTLEAQVQDELQCRGFPSADVEVLPRNASTHRLAHFVLARRRGGRAPPQQPFLQLRLRFATPVQGPLALGYASHFGIGRFEAAE